MKKVVWFAFLCALLVLGAMVFDYLYNDRFHKVQFEPVSVIDYQNKSEFSAPLVHEGDLCLMQGAVRLGDNLTVGAEAVVAVGEHRFDGYLYQVEPGFDGISLVTLSVVAPKTVQGEATATLYGTIHHNRMFLPPACITVNERGKDAVFVEVQGYAVLREVELGRLDARQGYEILSGVIPGERVVVAPRNLRTGDRVGE